MELAVSVTVTMTGEDGTSCPVSGELAAALAAPAGQFASMLTWGRQEAGALDHGDREMEIAQSGRELQRQLLEATFTIDGRLRGAARAGHQRGGDPARHGRERPRQGRGVHLRAGPRDAAGVPEPAGGEPVPG